MAAAELPAQARVVIVGGGIAGVSIAYHLTIVGRITSGAFGHTLGASVGMGGTSRVRAAVRSASTSRAGASKSRSRAPR